VPPNTIARRFAESPPADVVPAVDPAAVTGRLTSVDLLRGLVMIVMALDHTRDFFGDVATNPTDLRTASIALFLTRWITTFGAPTVFLLAGTGAFLALGRRTTGELSRFLLTRGLWLMVLDATALRFAWQFNLDYRVTILNVIWALGLSMVALSLLVRLPVRAVAAIGIAMIALHNLFDGFAPSPALAPVWSILHQPGVLAASPDRVLFLAYPLVPWIGVMAAGFALGAVYRWDAARRRTFLLRAGIACIVAFVLLRALNVYGDPRPWAVQGSGVRTALSFLNTSKYPPSLLFLLMTLGPVLLVLRAMDGVTPRLLRPAVTIGRVPFFYFVMHVVVIHLLAVLASLARYGTAASMVESPTLDRFPVTQPPGWPAPLPVVYLVWLVVVLALYPMCRWFAGVKARRRDAWWVGYV
jgi:uncharacterized membrane protein